RPTRSIVDFVRNDKWMQRHVARRNRGGSSVHVTFLPDIRLSVQRATMSVTMNVRNRRDALGGSRTAISARDAHSTPLRAGSALLLRACSLVFICSMGQRKM